MEQMITSGGIIDLIIVVMAIEMLFVLYIKQKMGRGPQIGEYLPHQLAGLSLLIALRSALTSLSIPLIAATLLGAFVCHLFYLKTHWRERSRIAFPKKSFSQRNNLPKSKAVEKIKTNYIKIGTQP